MGEQKKTAFLALLAASIIWGIAPPVIKYTLGYISPFSFLFYRFLLSFAIVIVPFALRLNKIRPKIQDWRTYFLLGVLCAPLNLGFLFLGIQRTTAIDASLISIISPILIILGGAFFLKEQISQNEKIGILLALLGTVLTIIQPLLETKNSTRLNNIEGNFLVLLGTFAWVAFTLLAKKNKRLDPFLLTGFSFLIGLVFTFPVFILEKTTLNVIALPGIIFMAVFSSVLAYFFYVFGLSKIEASEATVFTYLQPLFAVPISVIFLKEVLTLPFIFGAIFITLGVFICEFRFSK